MLYVLELYIKLNASLLMKLCLIHRWHLLHLLLCSTLHHTFFFLFNWSERTCILTGDLECSRKVSLKKGLKGKREEGMEMITSKQWCSGALTWINAGRRKRGGKKSRERANRDRGFVWRRQEKFLVMLKSVQ